MTADALGKIDWRPLRGVDSHRLTEARLQAHHALQWLARAARAYVAAQPDDSHTSLQWEANTDGFTTQPFGPGLRLCLRLPPLTLVLLDGGEPAAAQSFPLQGCTDAQARSWLAEKLGARNLDPSALDAPAPYEIPPHAVEEGAAYDAVRSTDALIELAAWYGNAAVLLDRVRTQKIERAPVFSPSRCWPHHFDLAMLSTLPTRNAVVDGSIGVGLSPGDEYYDEPYFYVSAYPDPDPAALPRLPALGGWHTHEFTAAVATASQILATNSPAAVMDVWSKAAVSIAVNLVAEAR
jgi:hypothetical protein